MIIYQKFNHFSRNKEVEAQINDNDYVLEIWIFLKFGIYHIYMNFIND